MSRARNFKWGRGERPVGNLGVLPLQPCPSPALDCPANAKPLLDCTFTRWPLMILHDFTPVSVRTHEKPCLFSLALRLPWTALVCQAFGLYKVAPSSSWPPHLFQNPLEIIWGSALPFAWLAWPSLWTVQGGPLIILHDSTAVSRKGEIYYYQAHFSWNTSIW